MHKLQAILLRQEVQVAQPQPLQQLYEQAKVLAKGLSLYPNPQTYTEKQNPLHRQDPRLVAHPEVNLPNTRIPTSTS